jgi:hypothetical protein
MLNRNPRWLPPQVIVLTQNHMGKYRNIFFSETIALIEPKLCINHWKVLYKLRRICKSKKDRLHNGQKNQRLSRACIIHLVIKRTWVFYADPKSKMAATTGQVLTQDHMGKYRNIFFSETIALIEPKLCINHWKVLYKLRTDWF